MNFPKPNNSGRSATQDGMITFTHLDSKGVAHTETLPVLTAQDVVRMMKARMARFEEAGPGSRESEESRRERKYVVAHPVGLLRKAWELADAHTRMEMEMAWSPASHHGTSDPQWVEKHAKRHYDIVGDNGRPL